MSNGNRNQRNRGNQQRRRRSGGGGRQQQAPRGPAMTALGESTYEAVFDHGNEGYGVWFDGMVREDPTYRQNWKGTGLRPIYVKIEEDRIVISKQLDRPRTQEAASDDGAGDEVFSDEEAARLFADGGAAAEESSDADGSDDDAADADEAPTPRKRVTRRRTTKADADDAADSDE